MGRFFHFLDRYYHLLLFAVCQKREHDGFKLYCLYEEKSERFFSLTIQALGLIQESDPRRYKRVKKHLPNIAFVKYGMNCYKPPARAFYVDSLTADVRDFAAAIVHEATHGYLNDLKLKYNKETQEQHERICTMEGMRFLRKVILEDPLISEEEKKSQIEIIEKQPFQDLKTHWWDGKLSRQRMLNRLKTQFLRNTTTKLYYVTGELWLEETYKNGELHGVMRRYYKNGSIQCEDDYKNGLLDGITTAYHMNGKIQSKTTNANGIHEGKFEQYFENGVLEQEGFYKNNAPNGQFKFYRENGTLASKANYIDGQLDGDCCFYDENGNVA